MRNRKERERKKERKRERERDADGKEICKRVEKILWVFQALKLNEILWKCQAKTKQETKNTFLYKHFLRTTDAARGTAQEWRSELDPLTMGQNQVILRHQKFTFPRAREWAKWASERTSERSGGRERIEQSGAIERVSSASEWANGQASGPVLSSRFLFIPDHSAATRMLTTGMMTMLSWVNGSENNSFIAKTELDVLRPKSVDFTP